MPNQNLNASIEKRLARYGAMSLAVASGFMAAPAHAGTIAIDTSSWAGNSTATGNVYFNPATGYFGNTSTGGAFELFHMGATQSSGSKLVLKGLLFSAGAAASAGGQFIGKFAFSSTISNSHASFIGNGRLEASNGFLSNPGGHLGQFSTGDIAYIGLEEAGHFGWAKVSILSGYQAQLLGFAYETDAGGPINPSLPEPSTLLMLALGSAGIAAYRRKATAK
jgi:hypothetical protein